MSSTTGREDLMSMHEAAAYLNVSWHTLRKRRKEWGIPAYVISRRPKFLRADLDEFRQSRLDKQRAA